MCLPTEYFDWIERHANDNPSTLRLKYHGRSNMDFDYSFAILQIECRKKYAKKLHETLSKTNRFVFPTTISGEQCTGDDIAAWHANLVNPGDKVLDLTAGLGIDAMHIASKASHITALELIKEHAEALKHNSEALGIKNLEVVNTDCRDYLESVADDSYDVVFIDPARRDDAGGRVYDIADCQPDVVALLPELRRIANKAVIKLSPMLDISRTISQLPGIEDIYAVGNATECKEVVASVNLRRVSGQRPVIHAITILNTIEVNDFSFTREEENEAELTIDEIIKGCYLYEPYPSVMKCAPYKLLCSGYGVKTVSANSHVFFDIAEKPEFPGRMLKIINVLPYSSSIIKRLVRTYPAIGVSTRNFPISAQDLRKKLKVKDADMPRLIATTDNSGAQIMIIADKK